MAKLVLIDRQTNQKIEMPLEIPKDVVQEFINSNKEEQLKILLEHVEEMDWFDYEKDFVMEELKNIFENEFEMYIS